MSLSSLGRRYERLLFFAAPLALASIVTLFVVFASNTQVERSTARCYESAASLVEAKRSEADEAWDDYTKLKRTTEARFDYLFKMRRLLIDARLGQPCWNLALEEVERRAQDGVDAFVKSLRSESKRLLATPVRYSGVELPDKATLSLLGTKVSIDLQLFVSLLQVVLAPLLMLWLGSLYNTRYRETLLIGQAKSVTEIFPHLINVYPAVRYPEPRRRSHVKPYLARLFAFMYTLTRMSLLAMLVGPIVAAYIASVILADVGTYTPLLQILAGVVATFSLALLLCELFPWHVGKTFPGPPLLPSRE
jgi:hypothetical protein